MAAGAEDRWGYSICASDNRGWTNNDISGWREGECLVEGWAKRQVAKYAAGLLLGMLTGTPVAVFTIPATIAELIGRPIGAFLKMYLIDLMATVAERDLILAYVMDDFSGIDVELRGDFEARYRLEAGSDLKKLKEVLAVIPAVFGTDEEPYFMGNNLVEKCYLLHLGYLRKCLRERPSRSTSIKLTIDIDV